MGVTIEETPVPPEVEKVNNEIRDAIAWRIREILDHLLAKNVEGGRLDHGPLDIDPDVVYVRVDGMPVYRLVVAYDEDEVALFGSWLPGNLERIDAN